MSSCSSEFLQMRLRRKEKGKKIRRELGDFTNSRALLCSAEKTTVGVAFIPWHFAEVAANILTNDALDPEAKIPEFKACAVQVFPAREEDLANPEVKVRRGRY